MIFGQKTKLIFKNLMSLIIFLVIFLWKLVISRKVIEKKAEMHKIVDSILHHQLFLDVILGNDLVRKYCHVNYLSSMGSGSTHGLSCSGCGIILPCLHVQISQTKSIHSKVSYLILQGQFLPSQPI